MNGELAALDFEKWLYDHPDLEQYIGNDLYLEFISFNFKTDSKYNLFKILEKIVSLGEYETYKLLTRLDDTLTSPSNLPELIEFFYDQYCDGYYFLQTIALGYALPIINHRETGSDIVFEFTPSSHEELKAAITEVITWIEQRKVILTGTKDELNRCEFIDLRETKDRE